ncbi:MAG: 5'-nucleotidase C-terminal domain-containing protein [Salaquimonas sp.]|jgi:5'-nucleotidase|nr:5'-nucleotidase C-terminal domain-containing protein [Salaquimonas sp.]
MRYLLSVSAAAMLALSASQAQADYILDILHINDFHSRIEPISKYDSTCSAEDDAEGKCFGGVARLKTFITNRRNELNADGANVLTLSAGDEFQGSLFFTTYKGAAEAEFMNDIGFDAAAVGNHEFDIGPAPLAKFIDTVKFPILGGNVEAASDPDLKGELGNYIVVERGGEKIGIIGVVTTETAAISSPGPNVKFDDVEDYIRKAVGKLEAQGINKIIALTHVGYEEDKRIATIPGVDVVVGGHSHTLLSNTDEHAAGPYPTLVEQADGTKVPVVQAKSYGKYVGELSVSFDDSGKVQGAYGAPNLIDASVKPDETIVARVAELAGPIEELKSKPVGMSTAAIEGSREVCRAEECSMGNLVADAMLDRVKNQGVTIAIQNGGGLRASIDAGEITMGEVLTVLPFQNTLATFGLSGADVVASLESGVSGLEEGKGQFPQVAGLRYAFDASVAPGEGRIKQVQVMENGKWTDIDPNKEYLLVSNNFMRGGGDNYKLFRDHATNAYDYGPGLEDVLADYLGAHNPYTPYTDGRIVKGDSLKMAMEKPAETMEKAADEVMKKSEETAEYVIKAGDNLWNLAKEKYGDATMWIKIRDANKIGHTRRLKIGQTITIPQ